MPKNESGSSDAGPRKRLRRNGDASCWGFADMSKPILHTLACAKLGSCCSLSEKELLELRRKYLASSYTEQQRMLMDLCIRRTDVRYKATSKYNFCIQFITSLFCVSTKRLSALRAKYVKATSSGSGDGLDDDSNRLKEDKKSAMDPYASSSSSLLLMSLNSSGPISGGSGSTAAAAAATIATAAGGSKGGANRGRARPLPPKPSPSSSSASSASSASSSASAAAPALNYPSSLHIGGSGENPSGPPMGLMTINSIINYEPGVDNSESLHGDSGADFYLHQHPIEEMESFESIDHHHGSNSNSNSNKTKRSSISRKPDELDVFLQFLKRSRRENPEFAQAQSEAAHEMLSQPPPSEPILADHHQNEHNSHIFEFLFQHQHPPEIPHYSHFHGRYSPFHEPLFPDIHPQEQNIFHSHPNQEKESSSSSSSHHHHHHPIIPSTSLHSIEQNDSLLQIPSSHQSAFVPYQNLHHHFQDDTDQMKPNKTKQKAEKGPKPFIIDPSIRGIRHFYEEFSKQARISQSTFYKWWQLYAEKDTDFAFKSQRAGDEGN